MWPETSQDNCWQSAKKRFESGDRAGALYLLRTLAQEGVADAYVEIGNIYQLGGGGVDKDPKQARRWFERAAQEANDPVAYFYLGRLYYVGEGVERDFEKAFEYLSKLEHLQQPAVHYLIGRMFEYGEGVPRNLAKARAYYAKASVGGHLLATSALGWIFLRQGRIVKAIGHLLKAYIAAFRSYGDRNQRWRTAVGWKPATD